MLLKEICSWPGVRASAAKTCVVFIHTKTFLIIKVMKSELDLKFVLDEETDEFPIYKRVSYGKKLEHYIRISDVGDIDASVWRFLKESYKLCGPSAAG